MVAAKLDVQAVHDCGSSKEGLQDMLNKQHYFKVKPATEGGKKEVTEKNIPETAAKASRGAFPWLFIFSGSQMGHTLSRLFLFK